MMAEYVDLTCSVREQREHNILNRSALLSVKRVRRPPLPGEEEVVINGKDATKSHQKIPVRSPGTKVYNQRGLLIQDGRDVCDCMDEHCVGCHYPCPRCQSLKCGAACRINRSWMYNGMDVEKGEKSLIPTPSTTRNNLHTLTMGNTERSTQNGTGGR